MNKKMMVITVISIVTLLGVGVWLFTSGHLVYIAKPGSTAVASTKVCAADTVDKYNTSASYLKRKGAATPSVDENALKELKAEIQSKSNYETDATCQDVLFWTAFFTNDAGGAKLAHAALKELHAKGQYPDPNIRSAVPFYTYETQLTALSGGEVQGGN